MLLEDQLLLHPSFRASLWVGVGSGGVRVVVARQLAVTQAWKEESAAS